MATVSIKQGHARWEEFKKTHEIMCVWGGGRHNDMKKRDFPVHIAPEKNEWQEESDTEVERGRRCEENNHAILITVVSELSVRQWHMRDIRAVQHDRQRSPVQCKNEDTSFSISAPLSTDRHTQTHTHTPTQRHTERKRAVPTSTVHFSITADRML